MTNSQVQNCWLSFLWKQIPRGQIYVQPWRLKGFGWGQTMHNTASDLIGQMCSFAPRIRWSAAQITDQDWVKFLPVVDGSACSAGGQREVACSRLYLGMPYVWYWNYCSVCRSYDDLTVSSFCCGLDLNDEVLVGECRHVTLLVRGVRLQSTT